MPLMHEGLIQTKPPNAERSWPLKLPAGTVSKNSQQTHKDGEGLTYHVNNPPIKEPHSTHWHRLESLRGIVSFCA